MEDVEITINQLLVNDIGDKMRLEEMLLRFQSGKKLYNSDIKYLTRLDKS